jgi:hypothetical protein
MWTIQTPSALRISTHIQLGGFAIIYPWEIPNQSISYQNPSKMD